MADNGENLVSQVQVTGTEESAAKLNAYADSGEKAFNRVNAAAKDGAAGVADAAAKIDSSAKAGAASMNQLGASGSRLGEFKSALGELSGALGKLSSSFQPLTQAAGRFAQRIALTGAGVVAAGAKIASSASGVAKALGSTSNAFDDNANAQIRANDSSLATQTAAINLESSQRKLLDQVNQGKITYAQYAQQLQQLNKDYDEQQRVAAQVENAQERVRLENERLKKSMEDRKALDALIDKFGGPLTSSLASFGNQVEGFRKQFIDAFGPAAASLIDLISGTLAKNSPAITAFFNNASAQIQALITKNGPQLEKFFENVGSAAASVFNGLIAAAPGIIDFVNNKLAPALAKISSVLNSLANGFNSVFGTNLTAGGLVVVAIFAQMTGSIRLLFALLKAGKGVVQAFFGVINAGATVVDAVFGIKATSAVVKFTTKLAAASGPLRIIIVLMQTLIPLIATFAGLIASTFGIPFTLAVAVVLALGAALAFLATKIDWKAVGAAALDFAKSVATAFGQLVTSGGQAVSSVISFFARLIAFFAALPGQIGAFFVSVWNGIVAGATAAVNGVVSVWNAIVSIFSQIGQGIAGALSNVWDIIVAAAQQGWQGVQDAWNVAVSFFSGLATQILTFLTGLWGTITQAASDAWAAVQAVWNQAVAFFQSIADQVTQFFVNLGTQIKNAFNDAVNTVKGYFSGLLASAQQFLQPILDLLNAIAALSSSASTAGGGAQGFAGGGTVRGPGGPTEDRIPAWLSNGEFVVKAKSVAKYGAGLLHRINSGQFQVPRFAMGGLVSHDFHRTPFADGGEVKSSAVLRPINLNLFGEQFNGLLAPEDVGQRLGKYAVARQNKSAGRKPAWVGRGRN